jgi:hypothetical protein
MVDQTYVVKMRENYIKQLYYRYNRPENLELEEEAGAGKKGLIFSKWSAKGYPGDEGYDDVPGDVLKLLGETGEWPKDFIEVNSNCLKELAKSYKMQRPSHSQQR